MCLVLAWHLRSMACLPPLTELASRVCAPNDDPPLGPEHSLCRGVKQLLTFPCSEITDVDRLEGMLARIGLKPHPRGERLYGTRGARNMVGRGGGMSQHPMQLAPALLRLSQLEVRSYLELGVDSGWTLAVVTAFLRRFGPVQVTGVDLTFAHIARTTKHTLKLFNVRLMQRPMYTPTTHDLCFIDASHVLRDVIADFEEMQPLCRNMLFHDVSDFDCWRNVGGGPARFWAGLKSQLPRHRWTEFVMQPDLYPSTFGLGLLLGGYPIEVNASAWAETREPAAARDITRRSLKYCLGGGGSARRGAAR